MRRSKILPLVLVFALALAGGLQAASLVPHVHGEDADHSSHPACPVHLAQQQSFQAVEAPGSLLPFFERAVGAAAVSVFYFVPSTLHTQEFLRGPPVSS